jgi:hypothetical protein
VQYEQREREISVELLLHAKAKAKAFKYCLLGRYNLLPVRICMPEKIARVQATIYVTTHLSIALAAAA